MNPSTNYECGMLTEGFDSSPMVMMTYNPRYYPELMEKAGLRKAKDLMAYISHAQKIEMAKIDRVADRAVKSNGVTIRPINMKNFDAEVERVWEVYGAAWARNWGYVPMTKEEFRLQGKDMKMILKPELVLIGEKNGQYRGLRAGLAGRQFCTETGRRPSFPPRDLQNPVLSTFDQKCTSTRIRRGGRIPRDGVGGGFLRHAGPQCTQVGFRPM